MLVCLFILYEKLHSIINMFCMEYYCIEKNSSHDIHILLHENSHIFACILYIDIHPHDRLYLTVLAFPSSLPVDLGLWLWQDGLITVVYSGLVLLFEEPPPFSSSFNETSGANCLLCLVHLPGSCPLKNQAVQCLQEFKDFHIIWMFWLSMVMSRIFTILLKMYAMGNPRFHFLGGGICSPWLQSTWGTSQEDQPPSKRIWCIQPENEWN